MKFGPMSGVPPAYGRLLAAPGAVAPPLDASLAAFARREGVEGLVYHRLAAAGGEADDALMAALGAVYRQTAASNLAALGRLGTVLDRFSRAGGQCLVLPGAALLPLYPDLGCRPMGDIDLMVRPGTQADFAEVMSQSGGRPVPRHPGLWICGLTVLDVHEDMFNCDRIATRRYAGWLDADCVWAAARPLELGGVRALGLGAEDRVLYTAAHALRHGFKRLTWGLDLGWALQGADWPRLLERAAQAGLEQALYYGMVFWRVFYGGRLGTEAENWMAHFRVTRTQALLWRRLLAHRGASGWGDALMACSIKGWRRRLLFGLETCFPRPAVMLQVFPRIPRFLLPLAYGLRLGQLGRAGLWRCWQLATGGRS